MKITIDEEICSKKEMTLEEVLVIFLIKGGVNIIELLQELENRKIISHKNNEIGEYLVSRKYSENVSDIILKSDKSIPKEENIIELASSLMQIFPKGKKEGTGCYWRGNKNDIKSKLQKFFKLYGNKYTNEQIINATKEYVKSFNGNYNYMRILKYFIWKAEKKTGEDGRNYIEEVSDLATFIENEGQEEELKKDWTSSLK